MDRPDVIVSWLQNDYGQLGRPAEAIAHALVDQQLARRVVYVEPPVASETPPVLDSRDERGLRVYQLRGMVPPATDVAAAIVSHAGLVDPVLLNFGVGDASWWFQFGYAPHCSKLVLVTHDLLHEWPGMPTERVEALARVRRALVRSSDAVCGLSTGSLAGVDSGIYVGHGCDDVWTRPGVDDLPEPPDLRDIPHPRVLYLGALSVRVEAAALRAVADAGLSVVLLGFSPAPDIAELIRDHDDVHFLGARAPEQTPPYLLHTDIGIVPHTDQPFTRSMEPHKLYNYACAGLRAVTLHCVCPPRLAPYVTVTEDTAGFVDACLRAVGQGRLPADAISDARTNTWSAVAARILDAIAE